MKYYPIPKSVNCTIDTAKMELRKEVKIDFIFLFYSLVSSTGGPGGGGMRHAQDIFDMFFGGWFDCFFC
jgi:hypothetical protein